MQGKYPDKANVHPTRQRLPYRKFCNLLTPALTERLAGKLDTELHLISAIILVADMRSFSEFAASLPPGHLRCQLSNYIRTMVTIIHQHGGLVDKFIGDMIIAAWSTRSEDDSFVQAFDCARSMITAAMKISFGQSSVSIGVGLDVGQVYLGNIEHQGKQRYTLIGPLLNTVLSYENATSGLTHAI